MKKNVLIIAMLLLMPFFLKADPPKKVNLSYQNGKLLIVVDHPVKNVNNHYINLISVSVNGKEVMVIKPTKQSSSQGETQEVVVPEIKPDCAVEVKAHCNRFGSKSAKLKL